MKRYRQANEDIHAPDDVKERAAHPAGQRSSYPRWAGAVAAVLAVAIIGGAAAWSGRAGVPTPDNEPMVLSNEGPEDAGAPRIADPPVRDGAPDAFGAYALAAASYPEMAQYPNEEDYFSGSEDSEKAWENYSEAWSAWWDSRQALRSETDYTGVLDQFLSSSTTQFLAGAGEDNRVYSPLNVYMALSMLAETTGGESRRQILDLLQADSIDAVRTRAADLWRDNYRDDGAVTSLLANSLWLRDGMAYSQDTLDRLASDYYASAFSGEMGSEAYNQALRDWINAQTGGLLSEQAEGLKMNPETVLALASTIYFKAAWDAEFSKDRTETDTFHAPTGDMDADFMHQTLETGTFFWGSSFTAVQLSFQEGGSMWLILPTEEATVDELLQSGEAMDFLLSPKYDRYDNEGNVVSEGWTGQKVLKINLSMPKFDVSSDLDLIDGLKALGVTDVFDMNVSNFDPLGASTGDPLYVSKAQHAARVTVDEEGCEAAAYTVMMVDSGAGMPPDDEVDFTLDRPFFFAITGGWSGLPLFTGVVNQPVAP